MLAPLLCVLSLVVRGALPPRWVEADLGGPALAGSASSAYGLWTLSGGGADVCNSDQFQFAWTPLNGDGMLQAQVLTLQGAPNAQAGVAIRNDTGVGAIEAAVLATASGSITFQWRTSAGLGCYYQVASIPSGAGMPVWLRLARSGAVFSAFWSADGVVWQPVGATQTIPMNPACLAGLALCANDNNALATATFENVTVPQPSFGAYRELWTGLSSTVGNTLGALTNRAYNPNWPDIPNTNYTAVYTTFETETNTGINYYGQRLRAFLVPPLDGNYTFWIASADTSELLLSLDELAADATPVCWVSGATAPRQWTAETNQQSAPIALKAGYRYHLEARMQHTTGNDNLAVRWQLPNGVFEEPLATSSSAGTRLVPNSGADLPPGIFLQPTNVLATDGGAAAFGLLVTNPGPVTYQWQANGANLTGPNARSPIYAISRANPSLNNGQTYACIVSNSVGWITSAPAVLTVPADTTPPAVLRAVYLGPTQVEIDFSEPLDVTGATNPVNYVFASGLAVNSARLNAGGAAVVLTTAPMAYASHYEVVLNGLQDRATLPNPIATNTTVSFVAAPFLPVGIGNPTPVGSMGADQSGYDLAGGGGGGISGVSDQFQFAYEMRGGDFDLKIRLAAFSQTDPFAKAGLMARGSLAINSPFAAVLATPSMNGTFFEDRASVGATAIATGKFPVNYPQGWLRLQRVGNQFTGYAGFDGLTWQQLGTATIALSDPIYLGMAVSSHNSSQLAVAQFQDLSPATNATASPLALPHEPLGVSSRRTPLVFSEIMYKPAPRGDSNNVEFVELYNTNPWFQDLSGYQVMADNLNYTFPPGAVLAGGAFVVVAASPASIQNVYGITNVVGPYAGSLKRSGTLQLLDSQGAVLLVVPYSNTYPWPVAADGTGHSLVLAHPTYGEGQPRAWDISDAVGGSPGLPESYRPSPLRNVVINEVLAHSENSNTLQFVELFNHSGQALDLSGCALTDDPATPKFALPAGTTIGPLGFLAFDQHQLGFQLNGAGGAVYLINPDRSRVLDTLPFEAQADQVSFGRWPDGADAFYALAAQTPGAGNSPARLADIVINELMYDPISGNDDDQYIELYNRGTNPVNLANWQFLSALSFNFPPGTTLAPDSYLVVAHNAANLFGKYTNLNAGNTVGNYTGKLSHKGQRVVLARPELLTTSSSKGLATNTIFVAEDEVTYDVGGRWGQWAHGGGSSLELINPNSNHRLAYNWADSDETTKSVWTNLEFTGVLDNGANYGSSIDVVQVGLLDVGECLVDNLEVRPGGSAGPNIVANGDFQSGLTGWTPYGDHIRSSLEAVGGLGGYQSSQSLHLRSSDGIWTLADYVQSALTQTTLTAGQTATLRLKARWLRGWPEVLMRLHGNWIEVSGAMPLPANLGTPGRRNSRYAANAGPAIYEVTHSPPLPASSQPVVVTARFHDVSPFQATLLYRVDAGYNPNPSYVSVPMLDKGAGGDAYAGDGIFSATIPGQTAGKVVAFLVRAVDTNGVTTLFPANLQNNAAVPRECVVAFGDTIPTTSFSHHHVFITQNWAQRWANGGGVSHEVYDATWVDGGGRVIYDWTGRYAGSPYHQNLGSPVTTVGGMHWIVPDDDPLLGVTSLNKQHVPGNGPLDDDTIQREQTCYWMAQQIGLGGQNRRYYVFYVNGVRHAPLMEDAQVPDADLLKEYFPNDNGGFLFKNHSWFEGDVAPTGNAYMNFNNMSWCTLGSYTTTVNGVPNQLKLARYRWMWWIRQFPDSANDYAPVFALIEAANLPTSNPAYYTQMEALVDTEEWMRLSAIEHASGDWDSFLTQNQWNMYNYKPNRGKWTALKWDWNISLGGGTSTWGPDASQLFTVGAPDPVMATFQTYPVYRRAYLRALQDIANLAMNNAKVNPLLNAKYAAFVANGLTTTSYGIIVNSPNALESWIGTMHNSIVSTLAGQGVNSLTFSVKSVVVNGNVATISGTAPIGVKTVLFNGVPWPLTWPTVSGWTATVPLGAGANTFIVAGVDTRGQPVAGATATATAVFSGPQISPVGQVVFNEIMCQPATIGAQFVEFYNNSTNSPFDLSGWQVPELSYTFPAGSFIGPNRFLVLGADRAAFARAYGIAVPLLDVFPVVPSASGGMLRLVQPASGASSNLVVAQVLYGSRAPWPTNANGAGVSLQLIDPLQDNWRVGNWAAVQTNSAITPPAQWQYVTLTGAAPRPILLLCLHGNTGDAYIDDLKLVEGSVPEAGLNLLTNGDFESPLSGPWTVSANMANSVITTAVSHSGKASLHLIATSFGDTIASSIWENTGAIVTNDTYTLSYWYLPGTNDALNPQLLVRLSGSSPSSGQVYSLANLQLTPPVVLSTATPGATNSVFTGLPAFPALWINEVQADNLTGITNRAGRRVPWIELYNPSTNSIPLTGLYLANTYTNLTQWAFQTNALIYPGQFKVIFADGQTTLSTTNELHASIGLTSGSGSLALSRLYNGQPQVLDYLDYTNLAPDTSYGSFPDGQAFARAQFFHPTPGANNDAAIPFSFIPYTAAEAVYTQDFNSLPNPGLTSVNSGNPVTISGITYSLGNPFDFAAPPAASGQSGGMGLAGLHGWYGLADPSASVGTRFGASDGDQTAGGVISFGPPGSTNRALGLLATSSTGFTAFGAKFINLTTNVFRQISARFTGEIWRQSDKAKTIAVYYLVDPTAAQSLSTNFTASLTNLCLSYPTVPSDVGGVAVDGTAPANQVNLSVEQPIRAWTPGAALWLIWQMADPTGKAQGLAIDDLTFSASTNFSANTPPVVAAPGDQWTYLGQTFALTITATDSDTPTQTLAFSLDPGAPANAGISAATGLLTWTPTPAQTPSTNAVTVRATDSGVPPLSGSQTFNLIALNPPSISVLNPNPNKIVLGFYGLPGKIYRLQYTGDLTTSVWTASGPDLRGNDGLLTITLDGPVAAQRFYRILVVQ